MGFRSCFERYQNRLLQVKNKNHLISCCVKQVGDESAKTIGTHLKTLVCGVKITGNLIHYSIWKTTNPPY